MSPPTRPTDGRADCDGCEDDAVFIADVGGGFVSLCDGCRSIVKSILCRSDGDE